MFMLKPKQLFTIIYVNVSVKRVYPHKTKNSILLSYGKKCEDRISHLSHLRSLIVMETKVNNLPFRKFEFSQER